MSACIPVMRPPRADGAPPGGYAPEPDPFLPLPPPPTLENIDLENPRSGTLPGSFCMLVISAPGAAGQRGGGAAAASAKGRRVRHADDVTAATGSRARGPADDAAHNEGLFSSFFPEVE